MSKRWLIIDTDAGVDDAIALCMMMRLQHNYNCSVRLITTTFGNCDLEQVGVNVRKCRAACGLANFPPISVGADKPLIQKRVDATYFHGSDGLGDANIPAPESKLDQRTATESILDVCREAIKEGAKVTVVTLGPLTNIAILLRTIASSDNTEVKGSKPEENKTQDVFRQALDKLVIMGGCGNGHGNVTRTAEFNVFADPDSAAEVFGAEDLPKTIVSWELCRAFPLPWPAFDQYIGDISGKDGKTVHDDDGTTKVQDFLQRVSHLPYVHRRNPPSSVANARTGVNGAVICDALAMAIAMDPSLITNSTDVHVEVELEGRLTRGTTVVDWGCYDGIFRHRSNTWVLGVDVQGYIRIVRELCEFEGC